jgi:hypothetical protein
MSNRPGIGVVDPVHRDAERGADRRSLGQRQAPGVEGEARVHRAEVDAVAAELFQEAHDRDQVQKLRHGGRVAQARALDPQRPRSSAAVPAIAGSAASARHGRCGRCPPSAGPRRRRRTGPARPARSARATPGPRSPPRRSRAPRIRPPAPPEASKLPVRSVSARSDPSSTRLSRTEIGSRPWPGASRRRRVSGASSATGGRRRSRSPGQTPPRPTSAPATSSQVPTRSRSTVSRVEAAALPDAARAAGHLQTRPGEVERRDLRRGPSRTSDLQRAGRAPPMRQPSAGIAREIPSRSLSDAQPARRPVGQVEPQIRRALPRHQPVGQHDAERGEPRPVEHRPRLQHRGPLGIRPDRALPCAGHGHARQLRRAGDAQIAVGRQRHVQPVGREASPGTSVSEAKPVTTASAVRPSLRQVAGVSRSSSRVRRW